MANVTVNPDAQVQFNKLTKAIQSRVVKLFKRLENWPVVSGVKALSGDLAGWYRLRTGDYRLRFFIDANGDVMVDKIGHRSDFYDD